MSSRHRFALAPFALVAILAQGQAHAQDYNPGVPPGYMQQDPSDANVLGDPSAMAADPPSRIATVTDMAGGLSFAPAGADEWAALGPNRPITTGDRLWVDPGGRAELHAGTTAVRLGGGTAVAILNLDDRTTQVKLTQGTLQLRVRALPQDQQVEIDTPNLAFVPREPGDYRLDVSPDGTTTLVTMRHGSAVLYGDTRSIELERGQRMRFAGTDLADAGAGSYPAPDSFDQWTAMRDAREDASVSARYVPPGMTGYTALDDYGDWQQDAGYGAVWFPRAMPAGWAPYSVGRWAWVAPWGWTWIDDAPWGFAPAHYGRWAHFGNRWGWVPGPRGGQPCYAPAVVGFIGGAGTTIRIGTGPGVAWYPLGPRDAYRPVYRASPGYVNRINYHAVNNGWIRGGDRDRDRGRWANREVPGAISGMPSRNFVEGRPVPRGSYRDEWRHLPAGEGRGAPPMAPVKTSLIGGARPHGLPPMARDGFERQAIAAHPPGRIGPDELARRFAREGGTAGAGPAWRGPVPDGRRQDAGSQRRGPQPVQGWQPDVRMSQAAPDRRFSGQRPDDGQRQQQAMQRQQFEQQRQLQDQQRQAADFRQQQQQAMQRQRDDQQRELQNQQRQGYEQQRRMQFDQQRMEQEQRRQLDDQRRDAMNRQQFDQQRQQQERQQQDMQRQAQQRQQQFDQQRQQQERQQQDMQRQAQQRQQQFDQQRQQQERQQQDMQRQQQQQQRQQLEQARQFQEQQRQQFEQQRQHALQRQQMEQQQRQAQEQQRRFQEQQQQQQHQQQQQQRQAQEQQRQFQEQQRQQQDRQRQFQQQQQQQQQRAQHERGRDQQARNNDGR